MSNDRVTHAGLWEIFWVFLKIGTISFGGGAIGYLRQAFIHDKKWLDDEEFLSALELSQTLPGLNATNMGVYVGRELRGIPGAVLAVAGLTLPGLAMVLGLGMAYTALKANEDVQASLHGVAAAATGFLFAIAIQTGSDQLRHLKPLAFVIITFLAMSIFQLPLVAIILVLGGLNVWLNRPSKQESK